ncbi:ribosomal protein L21 [Streptococcus agalactiae CJB111]|nr:ribosomal protein L21 [Streptococcus agalactiae CJB111]
MITSKSCFNHEKLSVDCVDNNFCIRLTVTLFTVATFFRFVFVRNNFLLFALFFNSTNNSSSFNNWSTNFSCFTTNKNNFVKCNFCSCFNVKFFNVDSLSYFNFNLFTTSFDDCVCAHDAPPIKISCEVSLCEDSPINRESLALLNLTIFARLHRMCI